VALIAAAFVSSPWVFYQLWRFVAAGLYPHEQKYVHIFAPVTLGLFLAGTLFSYYILVRFGIRFLVSFGVEMGIRIMPELDETVTFVLILSLIMGIIFQLPLVMLVLVKLRIFTSRGYASKRRLFIIIALTAAAVITPTTDVVNLVLVTAPILALYEIGIWICRLAERKREKQLAG
jgi:sec-independent protein translocase protein TatC